MATDDLENSGVVGAEDAGSAAGAVVEGGPKPERRGRKAFSDELERHLAENGLALTPVSEQRQASAAPVGSAVVVDEDGNRLGVEMLLNTVEAVSCSIVAGKAEIVLGDRSAADAFAKRAEMHPKQRAVIVDSGVKVCSKHGINIGPETPLIAALGQYAWAMHELIKELDRRAATKPEAPKD